MGWFGPSGNCGCCGCWSCETAPETVAVAADVSAGACCQFPDGTYTVGASDSATVLSRNTKDYDEDSHTIFPATQFLSTGVECSWTWLYRSTVSDGYDCLDGSVYSGGSTFPAFVAKCSDPYIYSVDGGGNTTQTATVMLKDWIVHVLWRNSPTVRIKVIISRVYHEIVCTHPTGVSGFSQYRMTVNDEYEATSLDCNSLPSTIDFTSRWVSFNLTSFAEVDAELTYLDGTFTACAAQASVSLTYA